MQLKVAVLEDDDALREEILVPDLIRLGFDVEGFGTSAALYRRMLAQNFDAVIVDIGLPEESGFDVAAYLRSTSSIGIVTLTGRSATKDQVRGLTQASDAWLVKPVDSEIVAATVQSVMRRIAAKRAEPQEKTWALFEANWRLRAPDGRSVALNSAEREILSRLLEVPGKRVPREELIAQLTDNSAEFDPHRLDMLIYRLRQKVLSSLGVTIPVRSVRGGGYVFVAPDNSAVAS
jgi:two-component system response regulator PhoP